MTCELCEYVYLIWDYYMYYTIASVRTQNSEAARVYASMFLRYAARDRSNNIASKFDQSEVEMFVRLTFQLVAPPACRSPCVSAPRFWVSQVLSQLCVLFVLFSLHKKSLVAKKNSRRVKRRSAGVPNRERTMLCAAKQDVHHVCPQPDFGQ